ncbi:MULTISPECIES: bacteriocin immunity protein [Tenebrionibacter/Tenebrionicola group]|jgi:hypothetical protein|uniref:Bacteriocin immunity protein n=2 Tax=Tenebrionibacter/Tenebrionicola group TaxID=2969848 RepID=A0A8K0XYA4_9ENTR|nr:MULTISPECIES: bacteriocin immunity protein [Tenebrionibacter/Tenebrionicola group]MBK4717181.1 bacteriocin immunity protein [Tenebrionibacter intestinalis]MBV5097677.1 bacteriocin immunity protein [Tenebrionicola larvae]
MDRLKNRLESYTETEFIDFMKEIFRENASGNEERLDSLLDHFEVITGHPDGTDLIYYAESDAECTPEVITQKVKEWRRANSLPGFKGS